MKMQDDRTPEEKRTHHVIFVGTDTFMSGWGEAHGGPSYAGWACEPKDRMSVERWVRNRGDMKRVREVATDYRPSGGGHCHIYVVRDGHPAVS